jgi:hypothetical protein
VRLAEHLKNVFGPITVSEEREAIEELESSSSSERKTENDFPEGDIDDMRSQRDQALLR